MTWTARELRKECERIWERERLARVGHLAGWLPMEQAQERNLGYWAWPAPLILVLVRGRKVNLKLKPSRQKRSQWPKYTWPVDLGAYRRKSYATDD